jgi:hypothetical protein
MTIAAALFERTPHRLRYLLTAPGGASVTPDTGFIRNRDAAGAADLRNDADVWRDSPIDRLVNIAAATDAEAETLFNGEGLTAVDDLPTNRGELRIIPRNENQDSADNFWSVRAVTGSGLDPGVPPAGSDGFPIITFTGPNTANAQAILTLEFTHTHAR